MRSFPAVVALGIILLAVAPGAQARVQADASAPQKRAKLRITSLGPVPSSLQAGASMRVRVRVTNLPKRLRETARLTYSLRSRPNARTGIHLRGVNVRRTRGGQTRTLDRRIDIPRSVRGGRYALRVCVRRGSGALLGHCRSRWITIRPWSPPGSGGPGGGGTPPPARLGQHSLRESVTDENFYFVMADRFENATQANDDGDASTPGAPDPAQRLTHGYDPTHTGFYHGGDLAGLIKRVDYIKNLGTTSIWLTPSFKNRAVQPEDNSAGYHGYWITDFTQIDPHLGTNAELKALVEAANARGMKVYFDIITNHTADVIGYTDAQRKRYVPKDRVPYRDASGRPFDDRDYAGTNSFPPLDATTSFPYKPSYSTSLPGASTIKVPSWLNDPIYYHNRGDTTFVGEDSYYGDFFGLDDLFTEHPRVVDGMIDIYKAWIRDMGIDGFRIDTMKHVNDEFWQRFAPEVLSYARQQGKREFFMFGEVFDTTKSFTSHFTTNAQVQAVLDFPFQEAARDFASRGRPAAGLRDFFVGDDWYTDADSNAYQLPTFLGNHDMGRIGLFLRSDNGGAGEEEIIARNRLAHELMYFSRGNPVIYYGDEQGFVGDGGDQGARQDMFPSRVASYNDDDLIGTNATTAEENFDESHPVYRTIAGLAALARSHPALRNGAQQHRFSSDGPGIYAFSRLQRENPREYVVALNNAESQQSASVPTYSASMRFEKVYGPGPDALTTTAGRRLELTLPALSTAVYRAVGRVARSDEAPSVAVVEPAHDDEGRDRMMVRADVGGDSFYEVTFLAKVGNGQWQSIGTDDNAPYRVFHDVADLAPGTRVQYQAVVLDNAGNERASNVRSARVAAPAITMEAPAAGARVRGETEVRAVATPEQSHYVVTIQRRIGGGEWTSIGTDASSPVYTAYDDVSALNQPAGTEIAYRAVLDYGGGTVTSAARTVQVAPPPVTTAIVRYVRPAGDYGTQATGWGLHLWGDAVDFSKTGPVEWGDPFGWTRIENGEAVYEIPIKDDTKPVNFIMHLPSGDVVPTSREPGGDRSFVPATSPEIWLKQGDATIYTSRPPG